MKSEDELVEEVLNGNHRSFELLLQPYRQGLLNMANRMTGNLEEAKEVCQEVLIKVYKHLDKFKKGRSFKSWIYRITVNSAYDSLRKKKKYENFVESQKKIGFSASYDPEKQLLNREIRAKIETCLRDLSPKEKATFLLRDGEGFSIEEASEILKCSSMSVRTHLSRARKKIREQFEKINFANTREVRR
ncbi:MAG: sigma-70 family RNA polymerase sigma factor [Candidatus Aminicenantes bacterium]|nr:sigma-70 family RNA polymerase sigma factor [Candidatus Aminicenantes bacterium]